MQLRRHGLQLLVLLMTLSIPVPWSAAEIPCPPINSGTVPSPSSLSREEAVFLSREAVLSPASLSPEEDAACIGKRSLLALLTEENAALLGFKFPEEINPDSVTLGSPFILAVIHLRDLRRYNPQTDDNVTDFIKLNENRRIYPLETKRPEDQKPVARAAVVVSKRENMWIPTELGFAPLVQAMTTYRNRPRFTSGFVVWIPALNLHFLADNPRERNLTNLWLIPLANRLAYGIVKGQEISADKVLTHYGREVHEPQLGVEQPS